MRYIRTEQEQKSSRTSIVGLDCRGEVVPIIASTSGMLWRAAPSGGRTLDLDRLQELQKVDTELRAQLYEIKDLRHKIQVMRKRRARRKREVAADMPHAKRGSR